VTLAIGLALPTASACHRLGHDEPRAPPLKPLVISSLLDLPGVVLLFLFLFLCVARLRLFLFLFL
jgi:hypothetical protein